MLATGQVITFGREIKITNSKLQLLAFVAFTLAALLALTPTYTALAKSARCFTTDDGHYDCQFKSTDKEGSFEITAKGKPKFILIIESSGIASGFADFGTGRNVSLPGQYLRQIEDRACWINSQTKARICAW